MSVSYVTNPHTRAGNATFTGRSYTVSFWVVTTTSSDGPQVVGNGCGVDIGDFYAWGNDSDERAYCTSISPVLEDGTQTVWNVTCTFETLSREDQKRLVHPLDRPYELSYDNEHFQEKVQLDIYDNFIANTAGEYPDPPIEREVSRPILTIVRNEESFPATIARTYAHSVNSDFFSGGEPGTVKINSITGSRVVEEFDNAEVIYWKVRYEFHYKPEGWQASFLSESRCELTTNDDDEVVATPILYASTGDQVIDPVPIDADGAVIAKSDILTQAHMVDVDIYVPRAFSVFGFV